MSPTRIALWLAPLFYAGALAMSVTLVSHANIVASTYAEISQHQSASAKADRMVDDILETLTFGLYGGNRETELAIESAMRTARYHESRTRAWSWSLFAASAAFIAVLVLGAFNDRPGPPTALIANLIAVSAVWLGVGLLCPILTVVARGELAVIGEVVLQYDSKGILSTTVSLLDTGNHFTAGLLFVFSALVPCGKIVLSTAVLAPLPVRVRRTAHRIIELIGRWSMTDVFVVAILLSFLAAESGKLINAEVGVGLYFFAGYGLLSLAAGHLMTHWRLGLDDAPAPG